MQKHTLLWTFMFVVISQSVLCGTIIQYSDDNLSWHNVTYQNNLLQEAAKEYLNEGQLYYFRGKNDTTNYTYLSQITNISGEASMSGLAGVFAFIGVGLILMFISFKTNERFKDLKFFLYFAAFPFYLLSILSAYITLATTSNSTDHQSLMYAGIIAILIILLTVIYLTFKEFIVETTQTLRK